MFLIAYFIFTMKKILDRTFSIKQTQANFSKFVWLYDYWGKLTEKKSIKEALIVSRLKNNIKVLDVGVGTGQLFREVIKINGDGFNIGLDLSKKMISKAKSNLRSNFNNFSLNIGNAFQLPYKTESFDFLFSSYLLDLLPEDEFIKVLKEFKRVMKPEAEGIIITMSIGTKWYNKIWYLLSKYFPSLLTNCRPVELYDYIISAGLLIERRKNTSQNTFASEIIKFRNRSSLDAG